ncbi:hypothetical protein LCGC14_1539510, partial [marine sediment metagenome]
MADKCECGHYEPSHYPPKNGHCNICSCEKFTKVEELETEQMKDGSTQPASPSCVPRTGVIPVLDSIAQTLREGGHQKAADYVAGYRDTIETQPAVAQEPLSLTEARGVLLVLDMLSASHLCWCAAGASDLVPDHNEICVKVQAL